MKGHIEEKRRAESPEGTREECLQWVEDLFEGRPGAVFMEEYNSWGDGVEYVIIWDRPMTEAEKEKARKKKAASVKANKAKAEKKETAERKELERLRKKYE